MGSLSGSGQQQLAALPLLAFQHHVGELNIDPSALQFLCTLSSSSDLAIVELARLVRPGAGAKPVRVMGVSCCLLDGGRGGPLCAHTRAPSRRLRD